ncbi:hypothetical protein [Deinococcus aerophilus]|uniref:EF-hand domain-containing protein n=1 Tax=Deinococcus aerophilus TaxID=522488 RepID=A0ABQ2H029_9DEIO|nr:hypothetical protein [Deinococcus aerophilus]GGM20517.1 hypothetical protein GCM10010841_30630 [Deinococcus aerophilus]
MKGRVSRLLCLLVAASALGASAATVKLRPQGDELTRAVQAALAAISTKELPVTLDASSGPVLALGGTGASAAPFNPDLSARTITLGGERRIEFNPAGPLPLAQAVQQELARELGFAEWTSAAARTRLSGADLNGDGQIDLTDLAILMSNYGKNTSVGDLNQDRKVDDADLRLFSTQYKPQPSRPEVTPSPATAPAAPTTPPEPTAPATPGAAPASPTPAPPVPTPPAPASPTQPAPPAEPAPPTEPTPAPPNQP